jgi:drug/metabolite transporter (DMT)-like permease
MRRAGSLADWLLLLSLVLIWGTAFLFIKIAVVEIPPATLVASRIGVAALVLTLAVYARGLRLPRQPAVWARYLLMGIVGNALPFTLISLGQTRVGSGVTGVLMAVMPLVTLVLAHFFVPGERMVARTAAGFLIGLAGLIVLSGPEALLELAGEASVFPYQAAILTGAVCYAVNTVLARRLASLDPLVSAATVMWAAGAVITPVALVLDQPWQLRPGPGTIAAVVWLGLSATALATILYFRLVVTAGPTFLSLMNYLIPVVALAAGVAVFNEPTPGSVFIGLALILGGLAVSQLSRGGGGEGSARRS